MERDYADMKTWRQSAAPIIEKVLAETAGKTEKEIRSALFDAYPFGQRQYFPYKIWLHEIRRQRGLLPPKLKVSRKQFINPGPSLFEEVSQ